MLPRNLLPSPSPFEAPLTRPAMSTISIVVGTTRFGRSISASRTSRSSGTVMTPTLGSIVQKGKFAACALAFDRQLNRVDLPTLGRPTIPHCKAIVSRLMLNLPAKIRLSREQCKFICDCRGGVSSVSAKDTNKREQCRIYLFEHCRAGGFGCSRRYTFFSMNAPERWGEYPLRVSPAANPQSIRAAAVAGAVRFSPSA